MPCRAVGRRRLPPCREGEPRTDADVGASPDHCDLRRVRGGGQAVRGREERRKMGAHTWSAYFAPVRGKRTCRAVGGCASRCPLLSPEQSEGDDNGHLEAQGGGAREWEDMQGGVRFGVSRILSRCHEGRVRGVVPSEKCL